MEWLNIIIAILGLSAVNFIFKWLFSKKFRESLRKNDFKNICQETDEYNDYTKDSSKENWQLQNATNQFLGTGKFHYSLIISNFKKYWDFRNKVRDLSFAFSFIEQKIENDKAELFYKYSRKNLRRVEKYNIWICVLIALLYIFTTLFEMFFLNKIITSYDFDILFYTTVRTVILTIVLLLLPISALLGSKASTALGLRNIFDIKDKQ